MIVVEQLSRRFGANIAVDALGFSVSPGEVLGFLGPNGAGKTTTMKMITGYLTPSGGRVTIFGDDVQRMPVKTRSQLGYLPEGAPLYPDMTPRQLLRFVAAVRGIAASRRSEREAFAIARLALDDVLDQRIETLSKGFRRRVGIAQAILHDPKVLILDEPTDGLDPNQKHEVRTLIRELATDRIVIVSTHILEEVDAVCTRALIIAKGRLRADSTPRELAQRSRYHGAVTVALNEMPRDTEVLQGLPGALSVEFATSGAPRITVLSDGKPGLFDRVRALAAERRWAIAGMYIETGRLDDVFRQLTEAA